jgi:hypothetical protein
VIRQYISRGAEVGAIAGAISSFFFASALIIVFFLPSPVNANISVVDFLGRIVYLLGYSLFPITIAVIIGCFTGAVFGFVWGQFHPDKLNYLKVCFAICIMICMVIGALLALLSLRDFLNPIAMSDGHVLMSLQLTAIVYLILCSIYVFVGFLVSRYLYNHFQFITDEISTSA